MAVGTDIKKNDFLTVAISVAGAVATAFVSYSFLEQLSPDLAAYSDAIVDVDLSNISAGKSIMVKWRGNMVVIRNRTEAEIAYANKIPLNSLKDKLARNPNISSDELANDIYRSAGVGKENWFIYINHCTHLGCPMLEQMAQNNRIFCPCHGSIYDTAGRIISGPAPQNLAIPPYKFISNKIVRIG